MPGVKSGKQVIEKAKGKQEEGNGGSRVATARSTVFFGRDDLLRNELKAWLRDN